ncbi:MAG: tape measure protein [Deltaproteobacteria bacterium]|nr:tape measure protein [Deltaproteobacteria bacterium]
MTVGELLFKLGIDTKAYEQGLARMEKQTQATSTRLGDMLKNAFSVAIGIGFFEAIRRGFQSVVGEAVNFNAMMEQARIGFTTMLGSAEKAQAFLDEMADFAARTPFEYPDLLEASRRMMAMGFAAEEVLPTMKAVGDATAGLGLGREGINRIILALGQMRAKAKISGEEMRQLTEAGIPAWEMLAEAMGKSTAEVMKLSEKGLIPANKAIQILIEGMEKRFPNMMENMENTWKGVTSTIRDVWRMTMGALTSGLFKSLTSWLQRVRDWATDFYDTFRRLGLSVALTKAFGADFAAAINTMTAILQGFWNTTKTIVKAIARHWAIIKPVVLGAVTAFLVFKTVTWVLTLARNAIVSFTLATAVMRGEAVVTSGILNFVARAVQIYRLQLHLASMAGIAHVGILQVLRTALYSVWAAMGPLGWAIMGVSAAVTGGIMLWSKYAASVERANLEKTLAAMSGQETEMADTSQQAAEGMEEQADGTEKAGKAAKDNLQPFDEINRLMADTAGAAEDITVGLDQIAMPALEAPEAATLPGLDMSVLDQAKPTLSGFWDWVKQGFVNAWDWIKEKTGLKWWEILATLTGPVGAIGVLIYKNWGKIKDWAAGLWEGVKERWSSFTNWVVGWAGPLWDSIQQKWDGFLAWAGNIWEGVKIKWGNFADWVSGLWGGIKKKTSVGWEKIVNTVLDNWDELKQGISNCWKNISNSISSWWDNFKRVAGTKWQSIVMTISTWWDNMRQMVGQHAAEHSYKMEQYK